MMLLSTRNVKNSFDNEMADTVDDDMTLTNTQSSISKSINSDESDDRLQSTTMTMSDGSSSRIDISSGNELSLPTTTDASAIPIASITTASFNFG
jgi:hypothetical protein